MALRKGLKWPLRKGPFQGQKFGPIFGAKMAPKNLQWMTTYAFKTQITFRRLWRHAFSHDKCEYPKRRYSRWFCLRQSAISCISKMILKICENILNQQKWKKYYFYCYFPFSKRFKQTSHWYTGKNWKFTVWKLYGHLLEGECSVVYF